MLKTFYHGTMRRLTIGFGTLFNNIHIQKKDAAGDIQLDYKVPFAYGPKEKFLSRINQNNTITGNETDVEITLPRISFAMGGLTYDTTRKMNTMNRNQIVNAANPSRVDWQYEKVPYNLEYNLSVMVKNTDDGLQIVEQILPYFTPDFNITLKDNPDMGFSTDIPISLTSVNHQDDYEGDFESRRVLVWDLTFVARMNLYPPTGERGIIRKVIVQSYPQTDDTSPENRNTAKPGKELVRIVIVPSPLNSDADDDYDYTTTQTDLFV